MSTTSWQTFLGSTNFPLIEDNIDGQTYYELLSKLYSYTEEGLEDASTALTEGLAEKQDILTFDEEPTEDSTNPVTSGGVYTALTEGLADKQDTLTFDTYPVEDSTNPVTSGGVYDAIAAGGGTINIDAEMSETSINAVQNAVITAALAEKQDTLTYDDAPTEDSTNPVTSGGIYTALTDGTVSKIGTSTVGSIRTPIYLNAGVPTVITYDTTPTSGSNKFVNSDGIYDALQDLQTNIDAKEDTLTWDTTPTSGSTNPVTSGGVYTALTNGTVSKIGTSSVGSYKVPVYIANGVPTVCQIDSEPTTTSNKLVTSGGVYTALEAKEDTLTWDDTPTEDSTNPVTSGGIYTALQNVYTFDTTPTEDSTNPVTSGGVYTALTEGLADKQDTLTFDTEPTLESTNPVTSGGVYSAIANLGYLTIDDTPTSGSSNPVTSNGIYEALLNKEDSLTWDTAPGIGSTNPVTSGGIYEALADKEDALTWDSTPTEDSSNPVTSGGVYSALADKQDTLTFDTYPTEDSTNPVTSGGVYEAIASGGGTIIVDDEMSETSTNPVQNMVITAALATKEDALTWDTTPTSESTNPVTSGGVYTALAGKEDTLTFDSTPTSGSTNPVTSGGVYTALANKFYDNAGSHNSIYRGANLGTEVTSAQQSAISAGTFDDMYIGDYWTINGTKYVIAAFDYYYQAGDTACTSHHVTLVPESNMYSAQMNSSATTEGGYIGSEMYTTNLATAISTISTDFGDMVMSHRNLLTTAVTSGAASSWAWYDSTVELMSESMVYGQGVCRSNNLYEVGISKSQLPLFRLNPNSINIRSSYWLRDVVSATGFSFVAGLGAAYYTSASASNGVRPAFSITG